MGTKRSFSLSLLLFCLTPLFATAQRYTVTDLGKISPTAINIWGQVAGNLKGHAYIWTKFGGLQDLGTLAGGSSSSPSAINDLGVVVGVADGPATVVSPNGVAHTCADVPQGFAWNQKSGMQGFGFTLIGGMNPCLEPSTSIVGYATGINDFGKVVSTDNWSSNSYVLAFLWTQSTGLTQLPFPTNLDLIYPLTEANGINNYSQMVGAVGCCIDLDQGHAFLWDNNNGTADLGTLGGPDTDFHEYCSEANGINDQSQVVGWSTTIPVPVGPPCIVADTNAPHAFVWSQQNGMQDLGTLSGDTMSMAYANNLFGQVIGTSGNSVASIPYHGLLGLTVVGHPFIWTQNRGMQDLNNLINSNSGWELNTATGINLWGQIVGEGMKNGKPRGFLLTPKTL